MKNYNLSNEKNIKDLAYHLNKNLSKHNIKHTEILEALSKSLGFNNWNTLKSIKNNSSKNFLVELLHTGNCYEISGFILSRCGRDLRSFDNGSFRRISLDLLYSVVEYLVYKREHESLVLDINRLTSSFLLENVILISKDKEIPHYLSEKINSYIKSLPQYKADKKEINEVTHDFHAHNYMQFYTGIYGFND